jgi:hypothetical protein
MIFWIFVVVCAALSLRFSDTAISERGPSVDRDPHSCQPPELFSGRGASASGY